LFHKIALLLLFKACKVSSIFAVDDDYLQQPKQKLKAKYDLAEKEVNLIVR